MTAKKETKLISWHCVGRLQNSSKQAWMMKWWSNREKVAGEIDACSPGDKLFVMPVRRAETEKDVGTATATWTKSAEQIAPMAMTTQRFTHWTAIIFFFFVRSAGFKSPCLRSIRRHRTLCGTYQYVRQPQIVMDSTVTTL